MWLTTNMDPAAVWRLSGSAFVAETGVPNHLGGEAAGGGMLLVTTAGTSGPGPVGFWYDGAFHPVPGLEASAGDVLPDGSVVFYQPDGAWVVGVGSGPTRTWFRLS